MTENTTTPFYSQQKKVLDNFHIWNHKCAYLLWVRDDMSEPENKAFHPCKTCPFVKKCPAFDHPDVGTPCNICKYVILPANSEPCWSCGRLGKFNSVN